MSSLVVTPSLLTGKRRFEEEEAYQPDLDKQPISAHKRSRLAASCSPLACRAPLAPNNNGSHAGALDLLRSLFPGMNDKVRHYVSLKVPWGLYAYLSLATGSNA